MVGWSSQWNSRLRQYLAYSGKSDGTFWMEYNDLCRHFNKVYMCRMLDDLWTRYTVKSRWMDETAGGCTNFISWRNNNQWLLRIDRPNTKLIIKLTQPDARKSSGNGRHYSNAIGFYIFKGNAPNKANDHLRRKLILAPGDGVTEGPNGEVGDYLFQTGTTGRVSTPRTPARPRLLLTPLLPPLQTPSSRGRSRWSTRSRSRRRRRTC